MKNLISTTDSIVDALRHRILSGQLKKGVKLPTERELAVEMDVSRSTLHNAICELEKQGFIRIVPRHGIFVADYMTYPTTETLLAIVDYDSDELDYSLFKDLMAIRLLLERESAILACSNAYDKTLKKMESIVGRMETIISMDNGDAASMEGMCEELSRATYEYHYHLMKSSGNSIYSMIYRSSESVLKTLLKKHYMNCPAHIQSIPKLHLDLTNSIKAGDEKLAASILTEILMQGVTELQKKYD